MGDCEGLEVLESVCVCEENVYQCACVCRDVNAKLKKNLKFSEPTNNNSKKINKI